MSSSIQCILAIIALFYELANGEDEEDSFEKTRCGYIPIHSVSVSIQCQLAYLLTKILSQAYSLLLAS